MQIPPFRTEEWFSEFEFTTEYLLAASDCESMTIGELLELCGANESDWRDRLLQYTEPRGGRALREAIAATGDSLGGRRVDPDWVTVLSAPQEGIFLTMNALIEPGDAVVVVEPCYDSLRQVAEFVGARIHPWRVRADADRWYFDLDDLAQLLRDVRPTLVIVNFPHNPTGAHLTHDEQLQLAELVASAGARLFFDEMYRGLELGGATPGRRLPSAALLGPSVVSLGGLSKAHGLPGLRCGWLVCEDPEVRERVASWRNYTTICSPAPTEVLAHAALRCEGALLSRSTELVRQNILLADEFFAFHTDAFTWRRPIAGSVALVETRWPEVTPVCRRWAEQAGVVLLPGEFLGAAPNCIRIGLGRQGLRRGLSAWEAAMR